MCPIASRITTCSPSASASRSARSWSMTHGWSEPATASGATSTACRPWRDPPVATITASGASASTASTSASTPRRTSTPRRAHSSARQSANAAISARPGQHRGEPDLPAELARDRSSSVTSWPRAAATHAASRPAGPPPTTTTRLRVDARRQRAAAERRLAPDARVRHARDRIALREVAVAPLVAAGARADLVGAFGARLVHPFGIGDQRAHDRDRVGFVALEDALGLVGREDAVHREHGHVGDRPLHDRRSRARRAGAARTSVAPCRCPTCRRSRSRSRRDRLAASAAAISAQSSGPEPVAVALLLVADEPHADRDAIARPRRAPPRAPRPRTGCRLSNEPPYSSVRRLYAGDRNSWMR